MLKELAAREPPSSLPQPEIQPQSQTCFPRCPTLVLRVNPRQTCPCWRALASPAAAAPRLLANAEGLSTPAPADPASCPCPLPGSLCLRPGSHLTCKGRTSAFQLTPGWGGEEGLCGVCDVCAHRCAVLLYTCVCVHRLWVCSVASFLLFQSLKRWGWAPSLSSSLPHPAPPILGHLHLPHTGNRLLSVHPSLSLGSSRHPSAPSPSYLRNRPGSRKAMTAQQLVGGRENPGKPDSMHGSVSAASGRTQTCPVGPRAGPSHPQPLVMCPPR